ncbi:hypothetical protein LCGC14_0288860 [marine sediment metagenome]|uniref:NTP pyrophosphohydrolase MazG putative catalytic core domain-containing protein n=1 Tax=marine sediment metagenome TaxID=412755 RepID=A0A0F9TYP6_9ZZZZ
MNFTFEGVTHAVYSERQRQDIKWGSQRHLDDTLWATILGEEYGELCEAILERDEEGMVKEAIQVAAVCFAFLEQRGFRVPPEDEGCYEQA